MWTFPKSDLKYRLTLRVVAVSDRRVTVGSAATLISQLDEGAQAARK